MALISHQFQVKLTSTSPQNQQSSDDDNDDIDAALSDLQVFYVLVFCTISTPYEGLSS